MPEKTEGRATSGTSRATPRAKGLNRRTVLKGAAATAGLAAGSGAISGFPTIWAQNIKDVTLLQVGGSYSAIIDIARKASEDLGFKVEMQTADHATLLNRLITQPESLDIADTEYFFLMYTVPRGVIQPIDLTKYKWWDQVVPIFTKGEYPDGRKVSNQGILPYEVQYVEGPGATRVPRRPDRLRDRDPDGLQRRHARHPAGPGRARDRRAGRSCSIRSSRGAPLWSTCPRSASWMPPWRSRRAATSSTATRAT